MASSSLKIKPLPGPKSLHDPGLPSSPASSCSTLPPSSLPQSLRAFFQFTESDDMICSSLSLEPSHLPPPSIQLMLIHVSTLSSNITYLGMIPQTSTLGHLLSLHAPMLQFYTYLGDYIINVCRSNWTVTSVKAQTVSITITTYSQCLPQWLARPTINAVSEWMNKWMDTYVNTAKRLMESWYYSYSSQRYHFSSSPYRPDRTTYLIHAWTLR